MRTLHSGNRVGAHTLAAALTVPPLSPGRLSGRGRRFLLAETRNQERLPLVSPMFAHSLSSRFSLNGCHVARPGNGLASISETFLSLLPSASIIQSSFLPLLPVLNRIFFPSGDHEGSSLLRWVGSSVSWVLPVPSEWMAHTCPYRVSIPDQNAIR